MLHFKILAGRDAVMRVQELVDNIVISRMSGGHSEILADKRAQPSGAKDFHLERNVKIMSRLSQ